VSTDLGVMKAKLLLSDDTSTEVRAVKPVHCNIASTHTYTHGKRVKVHCVAMRHTRCCECVGVCVAVSV
jgi:hypothetical protein